MAGGPVLTNRSSLSGARPPISITDDQDAVSNVDQSVVESRCWSRPNIETAASERGVTLAEASRSARNLTNQGGRIGPRPQPAKRGVGRAELLAAKAAAGGGLPGFRAVSAGAARLAGGGRTRGEAPIPTPPPAEDPVAAMGRKEEAEPAGSFVAPVFLLRKRL